MCWLFCGKYLIICISCLIFGVLHGVGFCYGVLFIGITHPDLSIELQKRKEKKIKIGDKYRRLVCDVVCL